jgi:hypothetical protein
MRDRDTKTQGAKRTAPGCAIRPSISPIVYPWCQFRKVALSTAKQAATPLGVAGIPPSLARVGTECQPWALLQNPFGFGY